MTASNQEFDTNNWILRLVAYIIDAIIIGIAAVIVGAIIAFATALTALATGGYFFYGGIWATFGIFGLLSILYFIILDVVWGGTIGKRVMGLHVQKETGGRVTYGESFIRNISKIFWLFLLLDWLIAVVTNGPDRRQKLSDRFAHTTVVQIRQPSTANINTQPQTQTPPPPPPPT